MNEVPRPSGSSQSQGRWAWPGRTHHFLHGLCPLRPLRALRRLGLFFLGMACLSSLLACAAPVPQASGNAPERVAERTPTQASVKAEVTHLTVAPGLHLTARVWAHPQPRHIVLGVHGFNDHSTAFEPLAQHLNADLEATVYAYDQRGFGANADAGIWPGTEVLLQDLRHITAQLRARHPGLPLTVVGESMGGAVALVAASESPGLMADRLILQAPAVWGEQSMPWYQRLSLRAMNLIAPDLRLTGRGLPSLGIRPTDDPDVSRALSLDPLFIKDTRVRSLAGVTELMGRAQNQSQWPPQATLVLYGLRDRIIPPSTVCDWLTHLSQHAPHPPATDVVIYPEGWHLLTRQLRARPPLQDMGHWLQNSRLPHQLTPTQAQRAVCSAPP